MEGLGAMFGGEGFEFIAQHIVGRYFWDSPTLDDSRNILAGPPDEQWQPRPLVDGINGVVSQTLIMGKAQIFIRVDHVYQVVGNLPALLRRRLGCANIHIAINLAAVGPDDFPIE